jgi:hypothetical protein
MFLKRPEQGKQFGFWHFENLSISIASSPDNAMKFWEILMMKIGFSLFWPTYKRKIEKSGLLRLALKCQELSIEPKIDKIGGNFFFQICTSNMLIQHLTCLFLQTVTSYEGLLRLFGTRLTCRFQKGKVQPQARSEARVIRPRRIGWADLCWAKIWRPFYVYSFIIHLYRFWYNASAIHLVKSSHTLTGLGRSRKEVVPLLRLQ